MKNLIHDLRHALRVLGKKPGFTPIAVLVLALGIGANTAIFSVVNAVLLRPLPYPDPDQLVAVHTSNSSRGLVHSMVSLHDFRDWQEQTHVFAHLAAFNSRSANISGGQAPERVDYAIVTANLFSVLGIKPILGRAFLPEEDAPGRGNVVVLSHGFWQRYFGSDPAVIGRMFLLNGERVAVVGVMPAQVRFPTSEVELWKPIAMRPDDTGDRAGRWLEAVARLNPGVTRSQAEATMQTIADRLAGTYPESNAGWGIGLTPLHQDQTSRVRPALLLLWGAVGLVLLIACANVANLLLARAAAREKEIAIRSALGAGRGRIIRQLLTESLLLACLGGVGGCLLAIWGTELLPGLSAEGFIPEIEIDRSVLIYSITLSALTGVLFGLIPAFRTSNVELGGALKEGGRTSTGAAHHRARGLLVISEVALTLVLLVGTGLLLRSFVTTQRVDLGFDPQNLLTLKVAPPQTQPRTDDAPGDFSRRFRKERQEMVEFYRAVVERAESLPGVESAGVTNVLPLSGERWTVGFNLEGYPSLSRADQPTTLARIVSPDFLRAMSIPLLEGRMLTESDNVDAPLVAVVSQTMARRHWPNESPVGKRIRFGENPAIFDWVSIVGVVGDARLRAVEAEPDGAVYLPFPQAIFGHFGDWGMTLAVRTLSNPTTLVGALRKRVQELDKTLPLYQIRSMDQVISGSVAQRRASVILLGAFATLALSLALVGIYGVISYSVSQRTHEIGVRIALGARRRSILRLVVGQGLRLTTIGIGIGLIASLAATRWLDSLLYGVSATDPLTFAAVSVLLTIVALAASYLPARRATRVDPITALRYE